MAYLKSHMIHVNQNEKNMIHVLFIKNVNPNETNIKKNFLFFCFFTFFININKGIQYGEEPIRRQNRHLHRRQNRNRYQCMSRTFYNSR